MILTNDIDKIKHKEKINVKCDYCSKLFYRAKGDVIAGRKKNQKDSCGDKECVLNKRKETNLKKYGVENPTQNKKIKEKQVSTLFKNYGVKVPSKSDDIKEKMANTNIEKYGNACSLHGKKQKIKTKKTWIKKYGCSHPFKNKEVTSKVKKSMDSKYGKHYTKTEEYLEKTKTTCLEKYGVEHHSQCQETKDKRIKTNKEKYGCEYVSQNPDILNKILKSNKNKPKAYGKTQSEIRDYLKQISGYEFQSSIIENKELDIFNSDLNLAFEYCGLWWHNEKSPDPRTKKYHHNKYKICENAGIRLITIFEDEWINRNKQCKNYIKSIFKIYENRIYARKCKTVELKSKEACEFYEKFHIQGKPQNTKKAFGLYYENELVGAMSLGSHHRKTDNLVINRLCFKENDQIIGGANKLFKKCKEYAKENNLKKIITWSDNRWSSGNIYIKLGFKLEKELDPDYSYVNLKKKYCRISKQSQKKSNSGCPKNITESIWAEMNNLAKIWDCGKKRWIFSLD